MDLEPVIFALKFSPAWDMHRLSGRGDLKFQEGTWSDRGLKFNGVDLFKYLYAHAAKHTEEKPKVLSLPAQGGEPGFIIWFLKNSLVDLGGYSWWCEQAQFPSPGERQVMIFCDPPEMASTVDYRPLGITQEMMVEPALIYSSTEVILH